MFEFIKPGTNFDFMGKRKVFLALSGTLVLASLVSLLTLSLDRGIEFKGGTKLIVSFKEGTSVDRGAIKKAVDELVSRELGVTKSQVEVQDFSPGTTGEGETGAHKYMIYTELTSLISAEKRQQVVDTLNARFGKDLIVDLPESGGDVFFLTFPKAARIPERVAEIRDTFTKAPLSFAAIQVTADKAKELEVEYVRELNLAIAESGGKGAPEALSMQAFEERKERALKEMDDLRFTVNAAEIQGRMTDLLRERFKDTFLAVDSATLVSPSVGASLFADGLLAMLYAIIGILLYIALRFNFTFSPGAVIALIHDSVITLGIISVLQIKFTLPMIAALLTIIGYSINDTIVVYDRIRENLEKYRGKALDAVINQSVNETLSRTILTSGTTMLVVVALLFLGGGLIQDFALALFVGILIGTYSSIFIASPFVLYLDKFFEKRKSKAKVQATA